MDTRVERNRRLREEKRRRICQSTVIVLTLLMLYYGIKMVNANIVYLDYFNDPTIFKLSIKGRELRLFGESYLIDLQILKKNQ